MEDFKYCKACLATDVEMFRLDTTSNDSIGSIYAQLTQIPIYSANQHDVCFECASLLHKYNKFKAKCHRAHNILYTMIHQETKQLNKQVIQSIDRKLNKLESNLMIMPAVVCHNSQLNDGDTKDAIVKVIETHQPEIETVEIKFENQKSNLNEFKVEFNEIDSLQSGLSTTVKFEYQEEEADDLDCNDALDFGDTLEDPQHDTKHEEVKTLKEEVKVLKRKSKLKMIKEPMTKKQKTTEIESEELDDKKVTKRIVDSLDLDDESLKECPDDSLVKDLDYSSEDSLPREISERRLKTKKRKVKQPTDGNVDEVSNTTNNNRGNLKKSPNKSSTRFNLSFFEKHADVQFLTPEDAIKELLLRKESLNCKVLPFKCGLCYRGFGVKAAYDNHMKKHNVECGEYECEICHLRYTKRLRLNHHRTLAHKTKISCKVCPYVCFSPIQMRLHIKVHMGKKYPCPDCDRSFSMPHSLVQHRRKHLKTETEVICEHCGSIFTSPKGLFVHNHKIHREEKIEKNGPKCNECNIHFSSEAAWKRHLVLSSKHIVSNGCKKCGEMFSNAEERREHMRVHARGEPKTRNSIKYPTCCSICDKCMYAYKEHREHVISEHPDTELAQRIIAKKQAPKPFVCEVCGQGFPHKATLGYHTRKHTGEKPYKCDVCGKAYWHPTNLAQHKKMHRPRERHPCETCGTVLMSSSALSKHRKIHLNRRPHKCVICEKGFPTPSDLATHVRHVHDRVPYPKRRTKRTNKNAKLNANKPH